MDKINDTVLNWIEEQYPGAFLRYPVGTSHFLIGKDNNISIYYYKAKISIVNHINKNGRVDARPAPSCNPSIKIDLADPDFFEKITKVINEYLQKTPLIKI